MDKIKIIRVIYKAVIAGLATLGLVVFLIVGCVYIFGNVKDGETMKTLLPIFSLLAGATIAGLVAIATNTKPDKDKLEN